MKKLRKKKRGTLELIDGSKRIEVLNVVNVSEFGKVRGLMFRRREKAKALLFSFSNKTNLKIHSFFVFFPFLAIWLDEKGKILDKKIVKSWRFSVLPSTKFYDSLLEIPLNDFYLSKIRTLVGTKDLNTF